VDSLPPVSLSKMNTFRLVPSSTASPARPQIGLRRAAAKTSRAKPYIPHTAEKVHVCRLARRCWPHVEPMTPQRITM